MKKVLLLITILFCFNLSGQIWEEYEKDGKFGIQDPSGKILIEAKYDGVFSNCGLRDSKNDTIVRFELGGKIIFVNANTGKEIPFQYESAWCFTEGLAGVQMGNKWGFIDLTGKLTIPSLYDQVYPFNFGFSNVKLDGKWGVIDKSNNLVCTFKFDDISEFFYEDAEIVGVKNSDKWGFMSRKGEVTIAPKYDYVAYAYRGFTKVNIGGQPGGKYNSIFGGNWGLVDSSGKELLPLSFEDISDVNDKIVPVKQNGKWGLTDIYGKQIIPFEYEWITCFYDGLAMVKINGSYGYINRNNQLIIEPIYENCYPFEKGRAHVYKNGTWFYIDKKGKLASNQNEDLPEGYENTEIIEVTDAQPTENGWTLSTKNEDDRYLYQNENGKFGYKNGKGNVIIKPIYDTAEPFENGKAKVTIGEKTVVINKKGKKVKG